MFKHLNISLQVIVRYVNSFLVFHGKIDTAEYYWCVQGEVAAALSVEPGTVVCRLERIKGVDGEPVVLFVSYFHLLRDKYASIPLTRCPVTAATGPVEHQRPCP